MLTFVENKKLGTKHKPMKTHYSPYFKGEHYIDFSLRNNTILGEIFVGDSGLLGEFELRSGLTCECLSVVERQANYYNAVREAAEIQPDCFIRDSFKIDEYGVAAELLRWRDELILAGWTSTIKGVSEKLDFIADVENIAIKECLNIKGESDRWKSLRESGTVFFSKDDELLIHFPEEHLPPYLIKYFQKLASLGLRLTYLVTDKSIAASGTNLEKIQKALLMQNKGTVDQLDPIDKKSFRILRFDGQNSAMEWVVTKNNSNGTVFINSDNRSFDNVQMLFANPLSGSSLTNANPEIVQLFKLGCSLFIKPLNIYNLLSYLQISKNPLPYALRRELIDVIISEGGIVNNKWEEVINEYIKGGEKNEAERKQRIKIFLPLEGDSENEIKIHDLQEYVKSLRTWASQTMIIMSGKTDDKDIELVLNQLSSLINFSNAFLIILNGQTTEKISSGKLKSWILSIYKPTDYSGSNPQQKSRFVIESPAAFADTAEKVIWMDCFNGTPEASVLKFLGREEKEALQKYGLQLWNEEEQIKAQLFEQKLSILNCSSEFTLIVSEKDKGEKLNTHPVMIQLAAQFKNLNCIESLNPLPEGASFEIPHHELPEIPVSVDMEQKGLFKPRKTESYSSISLLIQSPLDYVLNYQAGLTGHSVIEMSDEKRTMGNVAHLFVETLAKDSGNELTKMKHALEQDFQNRFEKAVLQRGAILLLDENRILLTRFAYQLKQSAANLLGIIENNDLSLTGCEVVKECIIRNKYPMEARIDILLKNKAGDYIIFDMKWTSSKSYYDRLILENRALQLEIYSEILRLSEPGSNIDAASYFDLSRGILITSHHFQGMNIREVTPKSNMNIAEQAFNSFSYRWDQLQDGKIEVADGLKLEELDYTIDSNRLNLFPLESDYSNKNLKAANRFSAFSTFKGGLK